jgi:hypothetical protein
MLGRLRNGKLPNDEVLVRALLASVVLGGAADRIRAISEVMHEASVAAAVPAYEALLEDPRSGTRAVAAAFLRGRGQDRDTELAAALRAGALDSLALRLFARRRATGFRCPLRRSSQVGSTLHLETEQMLSDADVISVRKALFTMDGKVRPVGRSQVSHCEGIGSRVSGEGRVPAAHERVAREDNITSFAADDGFCARQVENVPSHALDGSLAEPRMPRCGG